MIFNNFGYHIQITESSCNLPPGSKGQHLGFNAKWIKVNEEDWVCLTDVGTRYSWEWGKLLETCTSKEEVETFVSILREEVKRFREG